jgi:hypothetical protein
MPNTSRLLCGVAQLVRGGLQGGEAATNVSWHQQILASHAYCISLLMLCGPPRMRSECTVIPPKPSMDSPTPMMIHEHNVGPDTNHMPAALVELTAACCRSSLLCCRC